MKKVLIITYHWPPGGGPGVQRVLKFAKYLPEFGWQPVILTVKDGEYPAIDESLIAEINTEMKVVKTNSLAPFQLFKKITGRKNEDKISTYVLSEQQNRGIFESLLKWVRINVVLPDAKIGWLPFAVREGIQIVRDEKIDLIFSSSPPHTVQLIAAKIARKTGTKWVADFRDPWLEIVYYQNLKRFFLSRNIDRMLETKILKSADKIICISESIRELFKSKIDSDKYAVIPNGFDSSDFEMIRTKPEKTFTITYTGVLSDERIPYGLLPALVKMKKSKLKFKLRLVGSVCNKFRKLLKESELSDQTEYIDYVPHSESINYLKKSAVLLLVIDDVPQNKGFLSGKIFDYLGSKIPVLAFGPVEGDASKILKNSNSGIMVDYHDTEKTYAWLSDLYSTWPRGNPEFKFNIEPYERKQLTNQLVKVFDVLTTIN